MKYEGTKLPNFEPRDKVTEFEVVDIEAGTGEEVQPGATITAHYTGALCKNGVIFRARMILARLSLSDSTKSLKAGRTVCQA